MCDRWLASPSDPTDAARLFDAHEERSMHRRHRLVRASHTVRHARPACCLSISAPTPTSWIAHRVLERILSNGPVSIKVSSLTHWLYPSPETQLSILPLCGCGAISGQEMVLTPWAY